MSTHRGRPVVSAIRAIVVAVALTLGLSACNSGPDPHKCGPDDIDGDGDGRCNE
jgi:hypothetical protein